MSRSILALLSCAALLGSASAAHTGNIVWQPSLTKALDVARQQDKLLMVDLYTDWCTWCEKLDREVYTDDTVAAIVKAHFVPVKLDGDKHSAFVRKHRVSGYPTVLIMEANGTELVRIRGYEPSDLFAADLLDALQLRKLAKEAASLEQLVRNGKASAEQYARLGFIRRRLARRSPRRIPRRQPFAPQPPSSERALRLSRTVFACRLPSH